MAARSAASALSVWFHERGKPQRAPPAQDNHRGIGAKATGRALEMRDRRRRYRNKRLVDGDFGVYAADYFSRASRFGIVILLLIGAGMLNSPSLYVGSPISNSCSLNNSQYVRSMLLASARAACLLFVRPSRSGRIGPKEEKAR